MKQKLSSRFSMFARVLLSVLWQPIVWAVGLYFLPHSILVKWQGGVVALVVFQLLVVCFYVLRLKDVWVDENYLYLATLFKKSQAPLEAITSVTDRTQGRARLIEIIFAQPNDIGPKLSFIPYFSFSSVKNHPVTSEIRRLVTNKNQRMERYGAGLVEIGSH